MRIGNPAIADRAAEILGEVNESRHLEAFDVMKAETETVDVDIPTTEIVKYLMLFDKWLPIKESADVAAKKTIDAFTIFDSFNFSDPKTGALVKNKLSEMMDNLVTATLINAADKAAIMAMGSKENPVWPGLTPGYVQQSLRERQEGKI